MDPELKQHLQGTEARIVDRVMERVDGRLDAVEAHLGDFIREAVEDRITALERRQ